MTVIPEYNPFLMKGLVTETRSDTLNETTYPTIVWTTFVSYRYTYLPTKTEGHENGSGILFVWGLPGDQVPPTFCHCN